MHKPTKGIVLQVLESEPAIVAVLLRFTRDPEVIRDLLQLTYERLCLQAYIGTHIPYPVAYARSVARNAAIDWVRRTGCNPVICVDFEELLHAADGSTAIDDAVSAAQELEQLWKAICQLPPKCRQVLLLRKIDELSPKEIAAELDMSDDAVHRHLVRAAQLLRKYSETPVAQQEPST